MRFFDPRQLVERHRAGSRREDLVPRYDARELHAALSA
jgi:hypothetical protein